MAKIIDLIFVISITIGVFYTFLSHSIHSKYSFYKIPHTYDMLIGVIFLTFSYYLYDNINI